MNNITLIDDLPTIEELEIPKSSGMSMIPPNEANKYQKFIRNSGITTPPQSGMMSNSKMQQQQPTPPQPIMIANQRNMYHQQPPDDPNNLRDQMYSEIDFNPQLHRYHPPNDKYTHMTQSEKYNPYRTYENFDPSVSSNIKKNEPSCVDIAEHTANCLVCSKLYNNNNALLIILIVFLAIVNILLIKYVLDTCKKQPS